MVLYLSKVINNINNKINIYKNKNNYDYIFKSDLWNTLKLKIIYLKTNIRQKDKKLFKLLSSIRYGKLEASEINILYNINIDKKEIFKKKYKKWIILFGSNKNKNKYNNIMLNKINESIRIYDSKIINMQKIRKIYNYELFNVIPKKLVLKKYKDYVNKKY